MINISYVHGKRIRIANSLMLQDHIALIYHNVLGNNKVDILEWKLALSKESPYAFLNYCYGIWVYTVSVKNILKSLGKLTFIDKIKLMHRRIFVHKRLRGLYG